MTSFVNGLREDSEGNVLFVTGIDTGVGKTVVSAILVEALRADYWKPVQAGDLETSDSHTVQALVSEDTVIHPESYALSSPMSPHAAAEIDGLTVRISDMQVPETENSLVIEGAGGLLVPLNDEDTIADLIESCQQSLAERQSGTESNFGVICVSRFYLGSINHTLLTLSELKRRGVPLAGLIFVGEPVPTTEAAIVERYPEIPVLLHVPDTPEVNVEFVRRQAQRLLLALESESQAA